MSEEILLTELRDRVLTLTLNRPKQRNAINPPLMRALTEAARDAAEDARVGAVVLRGAGGFFCAGGDVSVGAGKKIEEKEKTPEEIKADEERRAKRGPNSFEYRVKWLRESCELSKLLHEMPKPTIALIEGAAAGAGLAIASACDFRVVADNAKFSAAFVQVALSGDYGGTYFMTHLLGPMKARELYLLGDKFDAKEADRIGLVSRLTAPDATEETAMELATRLANGPAVAQRYIKKVLNKAMTADLDQILDMEATYSTRAAETDDHREAAKAFFEKRAPQFKGR